MIRFDTVLQTFSKGNKGIREEEENRKKGINEWMEMRLKTLDCQGPLKKYSLFKGFTGFFSFGTEHLSCYHLEKLVCFISIFFVI